MTDHGLTVENLLRVFPPALTKDEKMVAIATAFVRQLVAMAKNVILAILYTRIDEMPEFLLDILAYDFKIDWWDPNYAIEEKRQTLKDSWYVHRHLGTKAAVETAISAIFMDSKVEEWFEYDGLAFMFRIAIGISQTGTTAEKQDNVLSRVQYYKNLRSHIDSISYKIERTGKVYAGGCGSVGACIEVYPPLNVTLETTGAVRIGGGVMVTPSIEVYPS